MPGVSLPRSRSLFGLRSRRRERTYGISNEFSSCTSFGSRAFLWMHFSCFAAASSELARDRTRCAICCHRLHWYCDGIQKCNRAKSQHADLTTTVYTDDYRLDRMQSLPVEQPRWQRRMSILLMLTGAAAGGFMLKHSVALPLLVCGLGSAAAALMVLARGPGLAESVPPIRHGEDR